MKHIYDIGEIFMEEIKDEIDEVINEEESNGMEISRYAITSYRTDRSIDNLIKWKDHGKLIIPDFQREYVWNYKNCVKFIESILLGLPIPDLFVYKEIKDGNEIYNLIDGFQRVSTIEAFKTGVWKAGTPDERKFAITNKQSKWFGQTYETLSDEDKDFFNDYIFSLTIFDSAEKSESKKKLYMTEVFERINTGSIKLSEQEVRNAVYAGEVLNRIKSITNSNSFLKLTSNDGNIKQRKKAEEIVLRFATYYLAYKNYQNGLNKFCDKADRNFTSSKNEMLSNFLYYANKNEIEYNTILDKIVQALDILHEFDPQAFYARSRDNLKISDRVHEIFAEAVVIATIENPIFKKTATELEKFKEQIWNDEDLKKLFTTSTTTLENVKNRVELVKQFLG